MPGARERVGRDERAGVVLGAVDAVGVGGEREDAAGAPSRASASAGEELAVAAAASGASHGHRGLAAGKQDERRIARLAPSLRS